MINPECFEKEWLESLKKSFDRNVDVHLLERTIYAFELLCQLTKINNNFIFKGGTSLVLLLPTLKRLSIDIDVIGKFSEEELTSIVSDSVFTNLIRIKGQVMIKFRKNISNFITRLNWILLKSIFCLMY